MSRTIEQFMTDLDSFQNYLQDSFTTDILTVSVMDMTAKIIGRVQQTGKLADGSIRNYSTKTTLVGAKSFKNPGTFQQLLSKSGSLKGKVKSGGKMIESGYRWVTVESGGKMVHLVVLPGGYLKIRQLEGETNTYKNYFRTGEMWRNTGLIKNKTTKEKVFIGGNTPEAQNKLNWNSWRDKENILMPTEAEVEEQAIFIKKKLIEYINRNLTKNV